MPTMSFVRTYLKRSIVFSILFVITAIFLSQFVFFATDFFDEFFNWGPQITMVIVSLMISLGYSPFRKRLVSLTDNIFYLKSHDYHESLKEISENNGIIYIAEFKNTPVGMIAGIIEEFTKNDEIEYISSKPAKVLELIVSEKNRGKNIGKLLMDKMEEYFKTKECDIIQVKVFEPNKDAHGFYKKLGYQDRFIDMIKESK